MNILVTGAKGMVGTALCNNLKNIRDGKNKTRPALDIKEIYEYDLDSTAEELDEYCQKADFVFNLAGVNRPENPEDFMKGNFGFASDLLNCLKKHDNKATIMLSSSIQATLAYVYVCDVKDEHVAAQMTDSEIRLEDHLSWATPDEIIKANSAFLDKEWIARDTKIVELIKEMC